jgi:aerobic C4-dicarboxylate transport protein
MKSLGVFRHLWVQVVVGIIAGVVVGALWPKFGAGLKPLGDAFINLIKMLIAPVIFCTVTSGIARMSDLKKFGRVGGKTLLYFEVVSTLALLIGLGVGLLLHPGTGFDIDPATLDPKVAAGYLEKAHASKGWVEYLLALIPKSFFSAFADGDLLQVLLLAIITGFACSRLGEFGDRCADAIDHVVKVFFSMIHIVVKLAPIGAFGAMAFTIGKYGIDALLPLAALVGVFFLTGILFVLIVLGAIARLAGFSIFRYLSYIREELLIVLGTSSSESVLPQIMEKLQRLGASKSVVGLVIPTGYSFNLDGTNIYMTLATLFLAQATNTNLTIWQELGILGIAMITSKGASGVTGAGFITLAATLSIVPDIPIQSIAILVGIDKFMSECRALTNLIGNGVACVVISLSEGELDRDALHEAMAHPLEMGEALEPGATPS